MNRNIKYLIPALLLDLYDYLIRIAQGKTYLPPRSLRGWVGDPNHYETVGQEFLGYFIGLCLLKPDEQILDIGCGSGRMALPLTKYINEEGRYVGIDVNERCIVWCKKRIAKVYPNFEFYHINLHNKEYNPRGQASPANYLFPFESHSFDFIFLTSVFTHMYPEDMEHYLREITRLLKIRGRTLITFFLVDQFQQISKSIGLYYGEFKHDSGIYRTVNANNPENGIAYQEDYIRTTFNKKNLIITDLRYGYWNGRKDGLSYQDIVIASRK